ncbi:sigma-54 interaction domain-containing protein [Clostridium aminobutyricum]|uniref:Sigma 54-interacting transcriptional regulator n=1 Tax=Clostridium aminobutyricum TaxID=33953 RepID=A0A939DAX3_CLOAM|nr:sigma 54-interacting transcriptional regulator [Clostridium aminobutyricum]MBN7773948.1 sigma 54-interacting transcriptional regulator [Clostridium aminobutyricum]
MVNFGQDRVIEPKGFIPVTAWRLDNKRALRKGEIRLAIKQIKLEEGSFRQLCNECEYDEFRIRQRIVDIVRKRGKLHNPSTDSGGICYGIVDEINADFNNKYQVEVGDKVVCITSLTSLPMELEEIVEINFNYAQIKVEGYVIMFESNPLIKMPDDLNLSYTLSALDESGSVTRAYYLAEKEKRILILGSGLLPILIYSSAIRKSVGNNCRIVAVLDRESTDTLSQDEIMKPLKRYVDELYIADILAPLETYRWIQESEIDKNHGEEELFDVSINCADLLGAETISVLLTKDRGKLFFTNLINNYNLVLLFAESLGKTINAISLEEYSMEFPNFTLNLLREIKDDLQVIDRVYNKYPIISRLPMRISELIKYQKLCKIDDYVFASEKTKKLLDDVLNIAEYDCNVIIQGETGVGKEKILSLIHKNSGRKMKPCIKINCSTIQENLAESELFGYESGAFTGANAAGKQGYFELANNGILFLDEIGDMPLSLQSKLLRVIQENQFYRVGGQKQINVNVRIICASNVNLRDLVSRGKFREDLYYRLNICEINIPPLRERKEDISCLAYNFVNKYNERYMKSVKIGEDALKSLEEYNWPGNVRELDNVVHRAVINTKSNRIDSFSVKNEMACNVQRRFDQQPESEEFPMNSVNLSASTIFDHPFYLDEMMEMHEKAIIEETLLKAKTTRKAADILGISQSQLMRKKKKYNL